MEQMSHICKSSALSVVRIFSGHLESAETRSFRTFRHGSNVRGTHRSFAAVFLHVCALEYSLMVASSTGSQNLIFSFLAFFFAG